MRIVIERIKNQQEKKHSASNNMKG